MSLTNVTLGNFSNLSISTATNLFLYGELSTPADYEDRLRDLDEYAALPWYSSVSGPSYQALRVEIDAVSYMSTGAGRYAYAANIPFVQDFMAGNITFGPGTYYRTDFTSAGSIYANPYGNPYTAQDFTTVVDNYRTDITSSDYATRTYVFGQSAFTVSQDTQFVVNGNGSREIKNIAVVPWNDNFDFQSDGWITSAGNTLLLKPLIDPYDIGRTLNIEYINIASITRTVLRTAIT